MKIRAFCHLNPLGKVFTNTEFLVAFCCTNISSTKIFFLIKLIYSVEYFSEIIVYTPFIWDSISTYTNNGTAKVAILTKIRVRVKGSTSKILNYPIGHVLGTNKLNINPIIFHFSLSNDS